MLSSGRSEMVARAWASYRAQTYADRVMVQYDNDGSKTIGVLRNAANALTGCDIICHWDSDDWSHPNRIAEQVALLQSSGAECVGYHEMLFWHEWTKTHTIDAGLGMSIDRIPVMQERCGESWLYREDGNHHVKNYAIGTSMCYWRKTWERFPFPNYSAGCDDWRWACGDTKTGVRAVNIASESSIVAGSLNSPEEKKMFPPRMIAAIHGGNTCANFMPGAQEWTRVPEWDAYCRKTMEL